MTGTNRIFTLPSRVNMFNGILSFLRSMAHSMSSQSQKAGPTNQTSPPLSDFVPLLTSRHLEIEEYMRLILANAYATTEGQDQLEQHWVVKLEHMKDGGKAQHEHVIATVIDHNKNKIRLSIGRSKGQGNATPKVDKKKSPQQSYNAGAVMALSSLPNSSQDSILKSSPAMDVVQNIGDLTFPGSRVRTVFEPRPSIPLLRLAIIIETVHERNTLYTILRNQCYWFAMLVMGVAMAQGGEVKSYPDKPAKGKTPECEIKYLRPVHISDSTVDSSGVCDIPIQPGPATEPSMTVGDLKTTVGTHNGIPIVALPPKEILSAALESQRRYEEVSQKLAAKKAERKAAEEALKQKIWEQAQRENEEFKRQVWEQARREAAQAVEADIAALRMQLATQKDQR
ncbi:hypothetical protein BDN70DRAFT_894293 [Pholiota conissans]|uniref:Uncharacterized protein n=1 Tax=Pholiota conissans TaxID=109636 RepID=A0A9P5Z2G4_9AGAR|nr:hypothetical protein BDN70DRAFT_894293 [Pholiota conissans]